MNIFHEVLYRPIFNLLVWLYNILPGNDLGLAIILLTLIVKFVLFPLSQKALKSQRALAKLQPELKALQEAHKENPEQQAKEIMALYAREKVNPAASCLPLLVQLPVLIILYSVMKNVLDSQGLSALYSFVENPGSIHPFTIGNISLATSSKVLAILAGITQFIAARQVISTQIQHPKTGASKDEDMLAAMNKQMMLVMPIMTTVICWTLPGGLSLYWVVSTVFQIVQQLVMMRAVPQEVAHVHPPQSNA